MVDESDMDFDEALSTVIVAARREQLQMNDEPAPILQKEAEVLNEAIKVVDSEAPERLD